MVNVLKKSDDIIERASRYKRTSVYFSELHYRGAESAYRSQQLLGVPVVIIGAVVTTSIFATLNTSPSIGWKIGAGILSLLGATFSALQTFLKFSEKASEHKTAAASYKALGRRIDIFLLKYEGSLDGSKNLATFQSALNELEKIAVTLGELGGASPHVTRPDSEEFNIEESERIP